MPASVTDGTRKRSLKSPHIPAQTRSPKDDRMPSAPRFPAAGFGLLISLCGCYHYGYSPYGSAPYGPSYPTMPGGGGGYMTPSEPYVPYGSPGAPGASPTPISPGGPTPIWQPGPQPLPGNPNNPTPYEQNGKGLVPQPTPDEEKPFGGGAPPAAQMTPANPAGVQLQTIEPAYPTGAATPATTVANNGGDPFDSSMRPVSSGSNVAARTANDPSRPNPFAHDARNFAWLRGIVDFDPQDQRWVMVYSGNPDAADRFGGSITLGDHPQMNRIKPGDVVLVEGGVDESSLDQHGKPLYRIDKLVPLKPKS
jgi:hypothetical protein